MKESKEEKNISDINDEDIYYVGQNNNDVNRMLNKEVLIKSISFALALIFVHALAAFQYWILHLFTYTINIFFVFVAIWYIYITVVMCVIVDFENAILNGRQLCLLKTEISLGKDIAVAISVITIFCISYHLISGYYYNSRWDTNYLVNIIRDGNLFLSTTIIWRIEAFRHPGVLAQKAYKICKYVVLIGLIFLLQTFIVGIILYKMLPIGM